MSRALEKAAAATGAPPYYRRAAIAGGLIVALTLVLDLVEDQPAQADARASGEASPRAAAPAGGPAPAAAPVPMITSISIPPRRAEESASPPRIEAVAGAITADAADAAPTPAPTPACEPLPAAEPVAAVELAPPPPGNGYFIQLGVFGAQANAEALRQALAAKGTPAYLESRVVVGPYPNRKAADAARAELSRAGHPEGLLVPPRK